MLGIMTDKTKKKKLSKFQGPKNMLHTMLIQFTYSFQEEETQVNRTRQRQYLMLDQKPCSSIEKYQKNPESFTGTNR